MFVIYGANTNPRTLVKTSGAGLPLGCTETGQLITTHATANVFNSGFVSVSNAAAGSQVLAAPAAGYKRVALAFSNPTVATYFQISLVGQTVGTLFGMLLTPYAPDGVVIPSIPFTMSGEGCPQGAVTARAITSSNSLFYYEALALI